jgi:CubicO group peptidase (beta-lactamase class C family)
LNIRLSIFAACKALTTYGIIALSLAHMGSAETAARRLQTYLDQRQKTGFSGTVFVRENDHVLVRKGYGKSDFDLQVPNTPDTLFRIGSITKPFTAAAVLLLQQEGKLNIDDSICKYLNNCPPEWQRVHLRHLLTHTSGIPDLFNDVKEAPLAETRKAIESAIEHKADRQLRSEPGANYSYSNFGYMLLGYAIEIAASKPWDVTLKELIFAPLNMPHTMYDDVWAIVPGRARGYTKKDGILNNIPYKDHSAYAAGGLLSTVDDMSRFVNALATDKLLPRNVSKEVFTPIRGEYGLGWQITDFFGRTAWDHTGEIDGFAGNVTYLPDTHSTIIVLSNVETESPKATVCDLAAALLNVSHLSQNDLASFTPSPDSLRQKAGLYRKDDGTQVEVSSESGRLVYRANGVSRTIVPLNADNFALLDKLDVQFQFEVDSAGRVVGMTARSCGHVLFSASKQP